LGALVTASNLLTVAAGLTLIMSLAVLTYQRLVAQEVEAARLAVQAEGDRLAARRRALQDSLQRVEQQISALEVAKNKEAVAASSRGERAAPVWDDAAEGDAFMARHPEVKQAVNGYAAGRVRAQFGPLLESLSLPLETRQKVEALLLKGFGMGASGPDPGRQMTLYSGDRAPAAETDADLLQMISRWRRQAESRDWVANLGGALWFTDSPLTPAQARQLVPLFDASAIAVPGRPPQYDWAGLKTRARAILTDAQLEGLAALQAQQEFNVMLSTPAQAGNPPPK
jgi:hypothetical protein